MPLFRHGFSVCWEVKQREMCEQLNYMVDVWVWPDNGWSQTTLNQYVINIYEISKWPVQIAWTCFQWMWKGFAYSTSLVGGLLKQNMLMSPCDTPSLNRQNSACPNYPSIIRLQKMNLVFSLTQKGSFVKRFVNFGWYWFIIFYLIRLDLGYACRVVSMNYAYWKIPLLVT